MEIIKLNRRFPFSFSSPLCHRLIDNYCRKVFADTNYCFYECFLSTIKHGGQGYYNGYKFMHCLLSHPAVDTILDYRD